MGLVFDQDSESAPTQGAVYGFSPFFWIERPLTILRDPQPPPASNYRYFREPELPHDRFRRGLGNADPFRNQEEIVARAKLRLVVVLSPDRQARNERLKRVVVASMYSVKDDDLGRRLRANDRVAPDLLYLPPDPDFLDGRDHFMVLTEVQPILREFLTRDHVPAMRLTPDYLRRLLERYWQFLANTEWQGVAPA